LTLTNPKLALMDPAGAQLVALSAVSGAAKSAQVSCVLAFTPGPMFNFVSKNEFMNIHPSIVAQVSAQP